MRHIRHLRRIGALSLAAVLGLTSLGLGQTAAAAPIRPPMMRLQVLSFNDYHGHLQPPEGTDATLGAPLDPSNTDVGGSEYLATKLTQLRAKARFSHTVAAGDLIGGSPFLSGLFHDEPSVESLNAMDLDVSSVGNHEFDEGVAELRRMQDGGCHPEDGCYAPWGAGGYPGADFPWLAANAYDSATDRTVLPGTEVKVVNGVRVGYIGMTLESTPTLVAQAGIQGIRFRDEVRVANENVRKLRAQGVRTIIVLLHEGGLQTGTYRDCTGISGPIVGIAERLHPEIDLVVTGHTHQPYVCSVDDPRGNPRTVVSSSSYGRTVTETSLLINRWTGQVKRSGTRATNHLVDRTTADPKLTAIVDKWEEASAPIANEVVGTVAEDINRSPDRDTEGPLANLIADAQLDATSAAADGGSQIAFMNPGGVRADLTAAEISGGEAPGEVTYGEAFAVQPFGNLLTVMNLTGAQIDALLEQQYVASRGRPQLILGVSRGFAFTYDPAAPQGSRVPAASITLNGTVLDPAATYRITTNNFLADGGDEFTVFQQGTDRIGGGDDLVAFTDYLGANSPVSAPEDRIAGI